MRHVPDEDERVIDADVCVVGGACAGLTAAVCAAANTGNLVEFFEATEG